MADDGKRVPEVARRLTGYAIAAIVCLGLVWHFGSRSSFSPDGEDLLWFAAFAVVAVPVLVVEDRLRKKIGPHEGFELVAVLVHWTIIVIGSVGLVLVVRWIAGHS